MKTLLAVIALTLPVSARAASTCATELRVAADGRELHFCRAASGMPHWVRIKGPETGGKWRHTTPNILNDGGLDLREGFMVRREVPVGVGPGGRGSDALVVYGEAGVWAVVDAYLAAQAVRLKREGFNSSGCADKVEHALKGAKHPVAVCLGADGRPSGVTIHQDGAWRWVSAAEIWEHERAGLSEGGIAGASDLDGLGWGRAPMHQRAVHRFFDDAEGVIARIIVGRTYAKKVRRAAVAGAALGAGGDSAAALVSP